MSSSTDQPAKRSGPTAIDDRGTKRRASRACVNCRTRKVRCDLVRGGLPCTNCRLDGVPCTIAESSRTRRPTLAASIAQSPYQGSANSPGVQPDQFPVSLTFEGVSDQIGLSHEGEDYEDDCQSASVRSPGRSSQASTIQQAQGLPNYIKPLPPHLRADDIEYLAKKDALTIPEPEFRDEVLRHFVHFVHPFMPILEVNDFITPILKADGSNPVSLLLFQAVMFVGVTFVDMDVLRSQGYQTRKSARKRFFYRVRLLYGLDAEPDRLALLQALLLMTFWYDAPEDEKDTWYWMGISLTLAQVIGIHRDPEHLRISPQAKRHRIRLWWSCFMRDRLLALGIRRPARIRPDDFNVPMLTVDDFNIGPVSDEMALFLRGSTVMQNAESQCTLATICIDLVKLCVCIGHVLLSQYSVLGNRAVSSEYFSTVMVFPKKRDELYGGTEKCDAELGEWYQKLSPCSRYSPSSEDKADEADQIISLHQTSLYMIYLTALGALHRPQAFRTSSSPGADEPSKSISRRKVTDAAVEITQLAYNMHRHNQLRYLSTSSIPAFVSAALIHLFNIQSAREEVRNLSIGRFFQCMQVLRQLQDMYGSADYAVYFLESVIQNTGIQVPMFAVKSSPRARRVQGGGGGGGAVSMLDTEYTMRRGSGGKAYPTPSSSGNNPVLAGSPPILSNEATGPQDKDLVMQAVESTVSSLRGNETFTPGSQHYSGMLLHDSDGQSGPRPGDWNEMDTLLSALINFDSDPPGVSMSPTYNANIT